MSANFTNFDYIILTILFLSSFFALIKGFIATCLSFIGWLVSIGCAIMLFPNLSNIIKDHIDNQLFSVLGSMFVCFLISFIITSMITNKLNSLTASMRGGAVDRSLGFTFGILRGLVLCCIIYWIIMLVFPVTAVFSNKKVPDWLAHSKTYPLLKSSSEILATLIPSELNKRAAKISDDVIKEKLSNLDPKQILLDNLYNSLPKDVTPYINKDKVEALLQDDTNASNRQNTVNSIVNDFKNSNSPASNDNDVISQIKNLLTQYNNVKSTNTNNNAKQPNELDNVINTLE